MATKKNSPVPVQQKQDVPGLGLKTTAIQNLAWPTNTNRFPLPDIKMTVDGPDTKDFDFVSHTDGYAGRRGK